MTTIRTNGCDVRRGLALTGSQMYDKPSPATIAKESLQNALDAIDSGGERKVVIGSAGNVFYCRDYGPGMSPEDVIVHYLRGFSSGKEGDKTRGSFGLAKIILLGSVDSFKLRTVKDGIQTIVTGKRGEWLEYANAGEFDVSLGMGTQTLPGGLEMTIAPADDGMASGTTYWAAFENACSAEMEAREILRWVRSPLNVALCDPIGMNDGLSRSKLSLVIEECPGLAEPQKRETVPGASLALFYDTGKPLTKASCVAVTSHGLKQFTSYFYLDARMPEGLSVEVTPTVTPDDPAYPYTLSRDGLKGEAKATLIRWVAALAEESKRHETRLLTQVKEGSRKLAGSRFEFIDMTGKVPGAIVCELVSDYRLGQFARIISKAYAECAEAMGGDFPNTVFAGLAFGGGFQACRCGHSEGRVYHAPFALEMTAGELLAQLPGIVIHELAHQDNRSEGEAHAVEMTRIMGMALKPLLAFQKRLTAFLEVNPEFPAWLNSTRERLYQYEDKETAERFVKSA